MQNAVRIVNEYEHSFGVFNSHEHHSSGASDSS